MESVETPALCMIMDESLLIVSETAPSPIRSATIVIVTLESFTGHFSRVYVSDKLSILLLSILATYMYTIPACLYPLGVLILKVNIVCIVFDLPFFTDRPVFALQSTC